MSQTPDSAEVRPGEDFRIDMDFDGLLRADDAIESIQAVTFSPSGPLFGGAAARGRIAQIRVYNFTTAQTYALTVTVQTVGGDVRKGEGTLIVKTP